LPPAAKTKPKALTDAQVAPLEAEARDPGLSKDWVVFGEGKTAKQVQIRLLPIKVERRIVDLLAPHMHLIEDLAGLQNNLQAFAEFARKAGEVLPEVLGAAFESQAITAEWLDENASGRQLVDALLAQVKKNGLADLLGGLSRRGAQSG